MTDVIETCGGNTRLVRFLNRLGVCASMDTHARYVQYRTTKSLKDGVMNDYPQDAFTVVLMITWTLFTVTQECIVANSS